MIVSHKHKFIFVKTAKTAGTSVEIFLSSLCGAEDIVTPIKEADEQLRKEVGGVGPGNCVMPSGARAYNHMSLKELYDGFPERDLSDYFKFTIERNPAEKLISLYFWDYKGKRPGVSPDEYVKLPGKLDILKERGWNLYTIDGEVAVDSVIDYGSLGPSLERILSGLGITGKVDLVSAKSGLRKDLRPASEILSDESLRIIRERFQEEIALMGYQL